LKRRSARRISAARRAAHLHDEDTMRTCLIVAVLGVLAPDALAQVRPDPGLKAADPALAVPQTTYRSAFDDYVPYREQPLAPWRNVNEDVARAGGHVGIFRGTGHGLGTQAAPAKPASGAPARSATDAGAQLPARGASEAPARKPTAGGSHGH
jgi:hypothetical protein